MKWKTSGSVAENASAPQKPHEKLQKSHKDLETRVCLKKGHSRRMIYTRGKLQHLKMLPALNTESNATLIDTTLQSQLQSQKLYFTLIPELSSRHHPPLLELQSCNSTPTQKILCLIWQV